MAVGPEEAHTAAAPHGGNARPLQGVPGDATLAWLLGENSHESRLGTQTWSLAGEMPMEQGRIDGR